MWQQHQQKQPDFPPPDATPDWLQAGYYQNIPHGEVNWAMLAQQWIAMRQIEEQQNVQRQLRMIQQQQQQVQQRDQQFLYHNRMGVPQLPPAGQPPLPPMQPDLPPPPPLNHNPPFHYQSSRTPLYPHPPPFYGPGSGPSASEGMLFPSGQPQAGRFMQPEAVGSPVPSFRPRYGSNAPLLQGPTPTNLPVAAKPQSFAPSLLTTDFQPPPGYIPPASLEPVPVQQSVDFRDMWPRQTAQDNTSTSPEPSAIDVQMRKQLPAWIREGLEKVEREKQKQQQQQEKERDEKMAVGSDGVSRIPKWRLEDTGISSDNEPSDDDVVPDGHRRYERSGNDPAADQSDGDRAVASEVESETENHVGQSPEEFKEELVTKLRFWMTSILLEVTSTEVTDVVRKFYKSSRASAQPKVLAQSSALASILGLFGEDERDEANSSSDTEGNDERSKDNASKEEFKVPMLPPTSSLVSVSKKKPTMATAISDGKLDTVAGSGALADNEGSSAKTTESAQKTAASELHSSSLAAPGKNDSAEKKERRSSARQDDSRSTKERSKRRRSKSRSRSRSKSRERDRSGRKKSPRHGRRRSRSPSPAKREHWHSRKNEEKSSRSKSSSKEDSDRRKREKRRSRSPDRRRY